MTSAIVLDASLALAWMLSEPGPAADLPPAAVAERVTWVPAIWEAECVNAILQAERAGRLGRLDAAVAVAEVGGFPVLLDSEPPSAPALLALARQYGLSAYDAMYLELAKRLACPLATLDTALRQAAQRAGIALVPERAA